MPFGFTCPRLFQGASRREPDFHFDDLQGSTRTEVQLWEIDGLPFTEEHPQPVRVVRSQERVTQQHYRQGQLRSETTDHEWVWMTTLDTRAFPAPLTRHLGHDGWKLENNGWNDLTQNWAPKHGFLHACQHPRRGARRSGLPTADGWPSFSSFVWPSRSAPLSPSCIPSCSGVTG